MPILDRLIGLETEYAIHFHPREGLVDSPTRFRLYQALVDRAKQHVLTAPAKHFKEGVFWANGGAVWFEAERPSAGGGLIEGSTPECRGPGEVLRYQRAQDQLLSQCARLAEVEGQFSLVKNDRDGYGHVYGAQENYEAIIGAGLSLWAWRAGLLLLVPLLLLTWIGIGLMIVGILAYLAIAGLVYLPLQLVVRNPRTVARVLFGRDLVEGQQTGSPTPVWLETTLLWITRLVTGPLALSLFLLAAVTAFRRTRRDLTPFLVSRCIISGAGMLDEEGDYLLADKATAINCVLGLGGFFKDRPIFTLGHFFKAMCAESWLSPRDFVHLFRRHQRLQIGLGDSNMAELAEYLRVGTTALVLDVIEAGALPKLPPLLHPIKALHQLCSDPTLRCSVPLAGGGQITALQIQRFYFEACWRYVREHFDASDEAFEILARWHEVLESLESVPSGDETPSSLIGSLDWVTKKHLLDEAGTDISVDARKKIDIRYHELSPIGYFPMLQAAGLAETLVSPKEIERAIRIPPADSPATMRGHYIREFSSEDTDLRVNWKRVFIRSSSGSKSISLDRYAQRRRVDLNRQANHQETPDSTPRDDASHDDASHDL